MRYHIAAFERGLAREECMYCPFQTVSKGRNSFERGKFIFNKFQIVMRTVMFGHLFKIAYIWRIQTHRHDCSKSNVINRIRAVF